MGDKRKRNQIAGEDAVETSDVNKKLKLSEKAKDEKRKKKNKSKPSKDVQMLNVDNVEVKAEAVDAALNSEKKKEKKEKKAKKHVEHDAAMAGLEDTKTNGEEAEEKEERSVSKKEKKKKKDKKIKKQKKSQEKAETNGADEETQAEMKSEELSTDDANAGREQPSADNETVQGQQGEAVKDDEPQNQSEKKHTRFICFIGNLPFTANQESVAKHFAKISPDFIRVPTERNGKKGRGFAFLEFSSYDRMKTCLKLYHHSSFDDGKSPARKINVELTAGGGGSKSETRKARIAAKNKKLSEERARVAKEKAKHKRIEDKKKQQQESSNTASEVDAGLGDVHPSRRARFA
ncbi:hypothetical protein VTO42DRAFT_1640 [Malbranchea cinnamomea]